MSSRGWPRCVAFLLLAQALSHSITDEDLGRGIERGRQRAPLHPGAGADGSDGSVDGNATSNTSTEPFSCRKESLSQREASQWLLGGCREGLAQRKEGAGVPEGLLSAPDQ